MDIDTDISGRFRYGYRLDINMGRNIDTDIYGKWNIVVHLVEGLFPQMKIEIIIICQACESSNP